MNKDIKRKRNWHKRNNIRKALKLRQLKIRVIWNCSLEQDWVLDTKEEIKKIRL